MEETYVRCGNRSLNPREDQPRGRFQDIPCVCRLWEGEKVGEREREEKAILRSRYMKDHCDYMEIYTFSLKEILSQNKITSIYMILLSSCYFFDTWVFNVKNIGVDTFRNIETFIIIISTYK